MNADRRRTLLPARAARDSKPAAGGVLAARARPWRKVLDAFGLWAGALRPTFEPVAAQNAGWACAAAISPGVPNAPVSGITCVCVFQDHIDQACAAEFGCEGPRRRLSSHISGVWMT